MGELSLNKFLKDNSKCILIYYQTLILNHFKRKSTRPKKILLLVKLIRIKC